VQDTFIKFFHQSTCDKVVSTDKMMIQARGPVWHRKQQSQGIIPQGLRGLDTDGTWSRRYQRGIVRYYVDSGAGGLAVGVHSTQFAIRDPAHRLFEPVLGLVAETLDDIVPADRPFVRIAGLCGATELAIR
jgi:hypothetical protein